MYFQLRWNPFDIPKQSSGQIDWVDGLRTVAGAGDPRSVNGLGIHVYACNASMKNKCKYSQNLYNIKINEF